MTTKFSPSDRLRSFKYAIKGILKAFREGHNLWIQLAMAALVVALGFIFEISVTEWLAVVFAIGLVLSAEIMNTAIEGLVDFISPDFNRKAAFVKDVAAGAVLVAAVTAAIIGGIVFIPHIIDRL